MCIEAGSYMLIIQCVEWNMEQKLLVSDVCIYKYICIIYLFYFHIYICIYKWNNDCKQWNVNTEQSDEIGLAVHIKGQNITNLLIHWIKLRLGIWIGE